MTCKSMADSWQKPLQYCKVISLQLIKINGGKKKLGHGPKCHLETPVIYFRLLEVFFFIFWWRVLQSKNLIPLIQVTLYIGVDVFLDEHFLSLISLLLHNSTG